MILITLVISQLLVNIWMCAPRQMLALCKAADAPATQVLRESGYACVHEQRLLSLASIDFVLFVQSTVARRW